MEFNWNDDYLFGSKGPNGTREQHLVSLPNERLRLSFKTGEVGRSDRIIGTLREQEGGLDEFGTGGKSHLGDRTSRSAVVDLGL